MASPGILLLMQDLRPFPKLELASSFLNIVPFLPPARMFHKDRDLKMFGSLPILHLKQYSAHKRYLISLGYI